MCWTGEGRVCKAEAMCFGRYTRCVGYKLLILALLSIVANVLLYFPNGETRFASEQRLGKYVECLHGILGGGFLVSKELALSFKLILVLIGFTVSSAVALIYRSHQQEPLKLCQKKSAMLLCNYY